MVAATTAIGLGLTAITSAYGIVSSEKARKDSKEATRAEQARISEADKEASIKRKSLIDKQRRTMGVDGSYKTGSTGGLGLVQDDKEVLG